MKKLAAQQEQGHQSPTSDAGPGAARVEAQDAVGNAESLARVGEPGPADPSVLALADLSLGEPHGSPRPSSHVRDGEVRPGEASSEVSMDERRFAAEGEDLFTMGVGPCHALAIYTPDTVTMLAHISNDRAQVDLSGIVHDVYARNGVTEGAAGVTFAGTRIHLVGGIDEDEYDQQVFDESVAFLERSFPGATVTYEFNPTGAKDMDDSSTSINLQLSFNGDIVIQRP